MGQSFRGLRRGEIRAIIDPKEFAVYTGVALTAMSFRHTDRGWQVVFRGHSRKKGAVYCLYVAVELEDALAGLLQMVSTKGGSRYWYPDKFS